MGLSNSSRFNFHNSPFGNLEQAPFVCSYVALLFADALSCLRIGRAGL